MELFVVLLSLALFKNIFLNDFFVCILTYRINIIPVRPKLPSPKLLFHFRVKTEQFSRCYTFHNLYYRLSRHHRYTLYQKMNMVFICSNLQKMYFKSPFDIFTNFDQAFCNFIRQYISPIFYWTNQMIQKQTLVMTLMNMFAHQANITFALQPLPPPRSIAARNSFD